MTIRKALFGGGFWLLGDVATVAFGFGAAGRAFGIEWPSRRGPFIVQVPGFYLRLGVWP